MIRTNSATLSKSDRSRVTFGQTLITSRCSNSRRFVCSRKDKYRRHRWTAGLVRDYRILEPRVSRRELAKIRNVDRDNLIVAVSELLDRSAEDFDGMDDRVLWYKSGIHVYDVMELAEEYAVETILEGDGRGAHHLELRSLVGPAGMQSTRLVIFFAASDQDKSASLGTSSVSPVSSVSSVSPVSSVSSVSSLS